MNDQLSVLNSWSLFWTDKIPGFLKIFPANLKVFFIRSSFELISATLKSFILTKICLFYNTLNNTPLYNWSQKLRWCCTVPLIEVETLPLFPGLIPFSRIFFIKNHKYGGFFFQVNSHFTRFSRLSGNPVDTTTNNTYTCSSKIGYLCKI